MSGTEYNFIPHEDQQYFLKDIEAFYKGTITREQFINKLKYYVALDLYYTQLGNRDNISRDLKYGGNGFVALQLNRESLTDIFAGEGIRTDAGFSTALYEFAKMYGVAYEYNAEIADIINTKIAPYRGTYVPTTELEIPYEQPTVVWKGYQASDGLIYEKLSDGTIRKTDRYMGSEKLKEGYPAEMGADGAWYADGFWISNQDLTLGQDIASDVKKTFDEQGETIATGLSGSAIGIGKIKNTSSKENFIGKSGPQISSKTFYNKDGEHIDLENPHGRDGQIHYQDKKGNKWIYDINKNNFYDLKGNVVPSRVQKKLNDPEIKKQLKKQNII